MTAPGPDGPTPTHEDASAREPEPRAGRHTGPEAPGGDGVPDGSRPTADDTAPEPAETPAGLVVNPAVDQPDGGLVTAVTVTVRHGYRDDEVADPDKNDAATVAAAVTGESAVDDATGTADVPVTARATDAPATATGTSDAPVTAGAADAPVTAALRRGADLSPAASLSPAERVFPTWTDPTARRASAMIGGPLGRHASVGRARVFTPLRVALLMGIAVLICGWLFKSPCIQQGSDGGLAQGGQRPWITGCYNDVVPLYGGRGLNDPQRDPYAYVWVENRPNDGPSGQVFLPSQVHLQDGHFVADDAGRTVTLSDRTLVGDPAAGYSEVQGETLVPVPTSDVGTIRYLEYPVVTGYFMWGVSALTSAYLGFAESTHLVPVPLDVAAYFTIGAILLGLMYLWVVECTAKIARRRVWDTAIMCLSPLLVVHAFTNWDLLAIGFTGGAMLAWARKRPGLAGILLGLGTAAKLYPVLLLGPLLVLCLRTGKMSAFVKAAVWAAVVWAAVNIPVYLAYPRAWSEFYTMNTGRAPEWDSWYYLYTVLSGTNPWAPADGKGPTLLNVLSLGLFVLACVAIGWFALSVHRRPRFAQLAFLVIAAFLLTNKVWSPQYSLWLVPLAALALPRWRRVLAWQFAEAAVWMLLLIGAFDSDTSKALSIHPFVGAAIIRDALLIALVVRIVKEAIRPELDLIRLAGDDDPTGGVLEGARDRFTIPSLPALVRRIRGADRATEPPPPDVPDSPVREPAGTLID